MGKDLPLLMVSLGLPLLTVSLGFPLFTVSLGFPLLTVSLGLPLLVASLVSCYSFWPIAFGPVPRRHIMVEVHG